jgi:hypothetical protein
VIKVTQNHKYKVAAIFSGSDIEVGDRKVKVIESVVVRNELNAQVVKYEREDGPSPSDADAYFTSVWSEDEEYLVFPLSRFHGFCIVRASQALESLQKQRCDDFIRVQIINPNIGLWHDFEGWSGSESFIFTAGIYGDQTRLEYQISSGELRTLDSNFKPLDLEGANRSGKVDIKRSPKE